MRHTLSLLLACLLLCPLAAAADSTTAPRAEIRLSDGSLVLGVVVAARDGVVEVETDFAGTLKIPMDKITSLHSSEPVVMQMADESVVEGQPLVIDDKAVQVTDQAGSSRSVALEDLLVVNPEPWELGRGYKWSGLANVAWTRQRGNTDTDELDYKLESVWRSERDRYTTKFNATLDETNGKKNAESWSALGKYDYFFDGPVYAGIKAHAEHDKFADLDLRYYIGPYIGREFYTDPIFEFSGDIGVSYVNEDYIEAKDDDYPGATWSLDMSSNYLGGDSRLYFNQLGVWNLDATSDVVINSTFGLAFPLLWNFEAAAEVLLEYDSGAVDDVDELDETYSFRIGYSW